MSVCDKLESPRKRQICMGINISPESRMDYLRWWKSEGIIDHYPEDVSENGHINVSYKPSRGLGDTIARLAKATGISRVVSAVAKFMGKDCGCKRRQEWLNSAFPYGSEELKNQIPASPEMPYHPIRKIHSWAVGITTAPRTRHRTLPDCVESVLANGWNPVLYAEPSTDLSGLPDGLEVIQNSEKLGVWRNWKAAAEDLLDRFPDAEFILTIQDDTVFHPQVRWFAEHFFPVNSRRVFSFYTPRHYGQRADVIDENGKVRLKNLPFESARKWMIRSRVQRGWKLKAYHKKVGVHKIQTRSLWGACAMAFPRKLLEALLNHQISATWLGHLGKMNPGKWRERQKSEPWRIQNSDTAIGNIINAMNWEYWCPVPSLADHVAEASADGVGHGGRGGRRSAAWFAAGDLRETFTKEAAEFLKGIQ